MNRRAMMKPHLTLLLIPVVLAGCNAPASETVQPPLAGSTIGGPFTLTDTTGKEVKWDDFKGKYRIVYFGYAWCPDVCPFDMQRIARGLAQFKTAHPDLASEVQPIFITVDPERDTPEKVAEFIHAFSDDFVGLTGTPEAIKAAEDAFKVYASKGELHEDGSYYVNHSNNTYLMGREGEPMALLPVDEGPDAVAAELARWIG